MFESLQLLPTDPILGLMGLYNNDPNPSKIDLGVGVYKDDAGGTPVMRAVKIAEHGLIGEELTKSYVGPAGNLEFNRLLSQCLLGKSSAAISDGRFSAIQTPGGCGALRVAAELIKKTNAQASIWVSDPTWGNHIPLLGDCGLTIREYPYLDREASCIDVDAMMTALSQVPAGDFVLLHGSCHNPSGVDLEWEHWQAIATLAQKNGFIPFVDMAYQGFALGLEEDALGLRHLVDSVPECLVAASCSKNFGLYKERVGLVGYLGENSTTAAIVKSHFLSIARGIYSMPPDHGAAIVARILGDRELSASWQAELEDMRLRICGLRTAFSTKMREVLGSNRFDFVERQKGMFSFLGLSVDEVTALRETFSIYILDSSRVNIAGSNLSSLEVVCDALGSIVPS